MLGRSRYRGRRLLLAGALGGWVYLCFFFFFFSFGEQADRDGIAHVEPVQPLRAIAPSYFPLFFLPFFLPPFFFFTIGARWPPLSFPLHFFPPSPFLPPLFDACRISWQASGMVMKKRA